VFIFRNQKRGLTKFLERARRLGLSDTDSETALSFLNHNEFGLCFDTVITQMYELDVRIDIEFYELIDEIGKEMNLTSNSYSFMKELIDDGNEISQIRK